MREIRFSEDERAQIVNKIQAYFATELDQDIGGFAAEFLLAFMSQEIGAFYYNQGLKDASAVLMSRLDELTDAIYQLEQPTKIRRQLVFIADCALWGQAIRHVLGHPGQQLSIEGWSGLNVCA